MTSVATFSKTILLLVFSSLSISRSKNKISPYKFFLFLLILLFISIVDTARTHMMIAIFIYFYGERYNLKKTLLMFPFLLVLFFIFVYMTLRRTDIDFSFDLVLWPFFSEAIFGSYGAYQTVEIINNNGSFLGSPIYFISDNLISLFHLKNLFQIHIHEVISSAMSNGVIALKYYPLGGHFFLSEFMIYFGYIAIILFPIFYYFYFKVIKNLPGELYVVYLSMSFMLIKAPVLVIIKTAILILIAYCFFSLITRILTRAINR
ncbi:hypothetical protein [Photobacterium leiognathi]|uniref:hypothetical protein n=1 Tax=Photobacterium leiognathi TaxID=553611 RepID=UPI00298214F4|nr:hypothetical protein [Photobacterium leiognathi]